jgi:hypothetical protein
MLGKTLLRPRALVYETMQRFQESRLKEVEKCITFRKKILYSGECETNFKIKIIGIDNLFEIYDKARKGAIDNGVF